MPVGQQPLIGISGTRYTRPSDLPGPTLLGVDLNDDYAHGIETAGGVPVVIPFYEDPSSIAKLAKRMDGLLLSGGEDVGPLLYGEEPRRGLGAIVPERDSLEQALIQEIMQQGKPILAICRGIQVLNAVLGGTLYQDLPTQWHGHIQHFQKARRSHLSHAINVSENSKLYKLLGDQTTIHANSYHHQAIKECAPNLRAVAWDSEGLVEAVEHEEADFVIGVQWHPENLWRTTTYYQGLFQGFVEAAARRMED